MVGPESAGAHPGPVCYKKGAIQAILVFGRLLAVFTGYPLGTRGCCDVKSTSVTLIQRRNNVVCQWVHFTLTVQG